MKKILFITVAALMIAVSASAQLKVSSTGNVSVGTTAASASKLSVGSAGHSRYAAFVKGNCKVDSGYVSAMVYSPVTFPDLYAHDISSSELAAFRNLQAKLYNQFSHNRDSVEMRDGIIPTEQHYAITSTSLRNNFPTLVIKDENNNYIANYAELIPLIIYNIQEIIDFIILQHGSSAAAHFGDSTQQADEEDAGSEEALPDNSRMARRILADARLYQNTPNPFTAQTTIRFHLPGEAQNAYIYIFDMTGKTLKQLPVDSSMDSVTIEGYELPSGMYLYSLVINGQEIDTKRMILSK